MFLITHTVDRGQHVVLTAAATAVPDGNWQPARSVELDPDYSIGKSDNLRSKVQKHNTGNTKIWTQTLNIKYL